MATPCAPRSAGRRPAPIKRDRRRSRSCSCSASGRPPRGFSLLGLGTALRPFTRQVKAAAADDSVKAIAVVVDSPGGLLGMVPEAAAAMRAARQRKPVVVAVAGLNASAVYWITAGGSRMTATPSASVGAVGVFCVRPSIVRQLDQEGIDVAVFSAGKYKTEGLEVVPLTNAERSATQARVDEAYQQFVADVAAGRLVPGARVRDSFGQGRIVSAAEGLRLGMIDAVEEVDDTIARVAAEPARMAAFDARRAALTARLLAGARARWVQAALAPHRRALARAAGLDHT